MIEALVISRLLRWAKWKFKNNEAAGYASQVNFVRLAPTTTHFVDRDPGIDTECELTEKAFNSMPVIYKSIIWVEYLSTDRTLYDKSHRFGRSKRHYRRTLEEAHVMIGTVIDQLYERRQESVA